MQSLGFLVLNKIHFGRLDHSICTLWNRQFYLVSPIVSPPRSKPRMASRSYRLRLLIKAGSFFHAVIFDKPESRSSLYSDRFLMTSEVSQPNHAILTECPTVVEKSLGLTHQRIVRASDCISSYSYSISYSGACNNYRLFIGDFEFFMSQHKNVKGTYLFEVECEYRPPRQTEYKVEYGCE